MFSDKLGSFLAQHLKSLLTSGGIFLLFSSITIKDGALPVEDLDPLGLPHDVLVLELLLGGLVVDFCLQIVEGLSLICSVHI